MSKKTISRTVILMAILLLCTGMGTFYYVRIALQENHRKADLFALVPQECEAIIEVNNLYNLSQSLHATAFAEAYHKECFSHLLSLIHEKFQALNKPEMHSVGEPMSHLLLSLHAPGSSADQVAYGYSGEACKLFLSSLLKQTQPLASSPKEVNYHGERILIYPVDNETFLAGYFHKEFYAISLQKRLIEKVIDTYRKRSPSVHADSLFSRLSTQKKPLNSIYLYARSLPLSEWTEFNILIHPEAIYLAGSCTGLPEDSFARRMAERKKVSLPAEKMLPAHTLLYKHFALPDTLPATPTQEEELSDYSLYDFWEEYTLKTVHGITFQEEDTSNLHRLFILPLSQPLTEVAPAWKQQLQRLPQSVWAGGRGYPLYAWPQHADEDPLLRDVAATEADAPLCATVYEQQLLLVAQRETLAYYLQQQTRPEAEESSFGREWRELAQESQFTQFANLELLPGHQQKYAPHIPPFILKHSDFFRHFTFSVQLIKASEQLNANLIFTYREE